MRSSGAHESNRKAELVGHNHATLPLSHRPLRRKSDVARRRGGFSSEVHVHSFIVERPLAHFRCRLGRQHGSFWLKVAPPPPIAIYEWINRANPSLFGSLPYPI